MLAVFLAAMGLCAQPEADRQALAKKVVKAMDLAGVMESSMASSQEAMGANLVESILRSNPAFASLNADQRGKVTVGLLALNKRLQERMQAELRKSMNVGEEVENVLAPVYAEYFEAAELKALLEFYETPVGRKLAKAAVATQSQVMQKMQADLVPRMLTVLERVVREEQANMASEIAKMADELAKSKR